MMFVLRFGLPVIGAALVMAPLLLLAQPVRAQATDAVWSVVEQTVRSEIASRWGVNPSTVRLDWGPHEGFGNVHSATPPEVVGSGAHGQWVVRLETDRGTVGVQVRAGSMAPVAVAANPLRRGQKLSSDDIEFEYRPVWGAPPEGELVDEPFLTSDLVGWTVQRTLTVGTPLEKPSVLPPNVVNSGQSVEVSWSTGPIQLLVVGRAVGTARAGELVTVRLETGKRVRGVAESDGTVRVSTRGSDQ